MNANHSYKPLNPLNCEIRLFELAPSNSDKICGKLINVSLNEYPTFDALSYKWGDPNPPCSITVDENENFEVSRNILNALTDIRLMDKPRAMWIDAICIYQNDKKEKAQQIRLMRYIYQQASTVRVWLDVEVDPDNTAFQRLASFNDDADLGHDPSFWRPLTSFFTNGYWTRVWIQEELVLASSIEFHCRRTVLPGEAYVAFTERFKALVLPVMNGDHSLDEAEAVEWAKLSADLDILGDAPCRKLVEYRSLQGNDKSSTPFTTGSIFYNFIQSGQLSTSKPQDRLYGLLAFSFDCDGNDFVIDYDLSLGVTFGQLILFVRRKYNSLTPLCYCSYRKTPIDGYEGVPSWIPCWQFVGHGPTPNYRPHYTAPGKLLPFHDDTNLTEPTLSVRGFCVNSVQFLGEEANSGFQPISSLIGNLKRLNETMTAVNPNLRRGILWVSQLINTLTEHPADKPEYASKKHNGFYELITAAEDAEIGKFTLLDYMFCPWCKQRGAINLMVGNLGERMFVGTKDGQYVLADTGAPQIGDEIWIIFGCPTPMVLRKSRANYIVVSHAIVGGLMHGEAVKDILETGEPGEHFKEEIRTIRLE